MTTIPEMPQPLRAFETRGAKDADPATASLVEDIGHARETDYFLMADQLTEEEKEIFTKVRAFGEAEVLPVSARTGDGVTAWCDWLRRAS